MEGSQLKGQLSTVGSPLETYLNPTNIWALVLIEPLVGWTTFLLNVKGKAASAL